MKLGQCNYNILRNRVFGSHFTCAVLWCRGPGGRGRRSRRPSPAAPSISPPIATPTPRSQVGGRMMPAGQDTVAWWSRPGPGHRASFSEGTQDQVAKKFIHATDIPMQRHESESRPGGPRPGLRVTGNLTPSRRPPRQPAAAPRNSRIQIKLQVTTTNLLVPGPSP